MYKIIKNDFFKYISEKQKKINKEATRRKNNKGNK